jgi:hypothetical protein
MLPSMLLAQVATLERVLRERSAALTEAKNKVSTVALQL